MCSANAKPAALMRLWHMLTRCGVKRGSHPPVMLTTRRSSADGCNGAATTGDPSLRQNTGMRTTAILTPDRLRARALLQNNRDLQEVERYVRVQTILDRGRYFDKAH